MLDVLTMVLTMSSIIKDYRNKSPYWIACFRGPDGRRLKRSTKTTDPELAKELALKWEQTGRAGLAGRLTEAHCRKVIAEMYERTVGQPLHFHTAHAYLVEWLEGTKDTVATRSYWRYYQTIHEFLNHIGTKAEGLLSEITPIDVRSWRDALKRKGLSAPTVNGAIKVLRMPFKAAHDNGYIEINPCTKNSIRPLRDEARNVAKDVFTPQQIAALMEIAEGDWKGAILCAFYTGLRLRDVTELRWNAIDIAEGTITVTTRKTRKDVTVPVHPQFAAWLKKQTRGIGKAPVFPTLAGKSGAGKSGLSMQFKRIMERAGIRGRILRQSTGEGRSQSSLSFHSLRHSFNAALANAGVGVEMRQELIGHSSVEMNRLYTHPDIEVKRKAVELLPGIPLARTKE
jgi:integrase